jgi:GNAT superfamily N-acetyltransferase
VNDTAGDRGTLRLADGTELLVRPIRRSDSPELRDFHERLSSETQRQRYLVSHPHLSYRELDRLTMLDHDHREALVVLDGDEIVGVARYERSFGDPTSAEAKLVIRDDHQREGLGVALLRCLVDLARARGLCRLVIVTLPDNTRMWATAHDAGYPCDEVSDGKLVRLTMHLDGPRS